MDKGMAKTTFTNQAGIEVPLICGAMYPCSNPELIAAVSEAGGIGIIQPLSLIYVYGYDLREGIKVIRSRTKNPVGFNVIVEKSSRIYEERMRRWTDIAIEEGIRFFITALGNPGWVVEKVHAVSGIVYHDVTERKWADKAMDNSVDGLICVNNRAGGHAGALSLRQLFDELGGLGVPLICAGGVGNENDFRNALEMGYAGVQMGTRFIATNECNSHHDYKDAIVKAREEDIVLTEKVSGVPLSVIRTPYIEKIGTKAGFLAKFLLRGRKTRHWMRMIYYLRSFSKLKKASLEGKGYKDYFQAGKSVESITSVESAGEIVRRFAKSVP